MQHAAGVALVTAHRARLNQDSHPVPLLLLLLLLLWPIALLLLLLPWLLTRLLPTLLLLTLLLLLLLGTCGPIDVYPAVAQQIDCCQPTLLCC